MISPNSFCGFIFTRALDMNLDPPFLYNLLNKNEETNLIYYSETVEFCIRFWNHISQLIPVDLSSQRPKYMILDPPILQNPLNQNEELNFDLTKINYYSETVEIYTRFWNDISQLILWIYLH